MSSYDDVCHGVEDKTDVPRVSGTRIVGVDLLLFASLIESEETFADVVLAVVKCVGTCGENTW